MTSLQWGGRFERAPDAALLAFGSSLEDDLLLAPFDVRCSRAHVTALRNAAIVSPETAGALDAALQRVAGEIEAGTFAPFARSSGAEDIHGAIDARVRELVPGTGGELLHAGRSRNDQVATTLLLYVRDRSAAGESTCRAIAAALLDRADGALETRAVLPATTHWQPAQPVSLAFWLVAASEPFTRCATRFARVASDAAAFSPLGSAALAGSTLPLDRRAAAAELGFGAPSRNAMDAVGSRDAALDLLYAFERAVGWASRLAEELVIWCTPQFAYARLGDAASTGSSLMPQKRNPDPFELVRARAAGTLGALAAALGTTHGIALSYHRDLQETKAHVVRGSEQARAALDAFAVALAHVTFDEDVMRAWAGRGYGVATDIADALILRGVTAREAHHAVGARVKEAEREGRDMNATDLRALESLAGGTLEAPLDAAASVNAKRTAGSTHPDAVRASIDALRAELSA